MCTSPEKYARRSLCNAGRTLLAVVVSALVLVAFPARAQDSGESADAGAQITREECSRISNLVEAQMAYIEVAQLALTKSASPQILAFARQEIDEHGAALEDLRTLAWEQRREQLERFVAPLDPARFDLSQIIPAATFEELALIRDKARDDAIEGVMLKRRDSPYVAGRRTGLWYKWKRDPLQIDCVLMYAQRGSGKRSSFYSDFTFGCWNGDPDAGAELLPVGKAYFGFTDEELKWLDAHVRRHTVNRFGPVRETDRSLVLEVAFDSVHASKRHKSGLAMRFPRIARIRSDKPAHEADRIETLRALVRD